MEMKKFIFFLSLSILTLPSFSQTVTRTVSSDTMVLIPKRVVGYMISDIKKSDSKLMELENLSQEVMNKNNIIDSLTNSNGNLSGQLVECKATVDELTNIDEVNQGTISTLTKDIKKYKRQRNALKIFSTIILITVIIL